MKSKISPSVFVLPPALKGSSLLNRFSAPAPGVAEDAKGSSVDVLEPKGSPLLKGSEFISLKGSGVTFELNGSEDVLGKGSDDVEFVKGSGVAESLKGSGDVEVLKGSGVVDSLKGSGVVDSLKGSGVAVLWKRSGGVDLLKGSGVVEFLKGSAPNGSEGKPSDLNGSVRGNKH